MEDTDDITVGKPESLKQDNHVAALNTLDYNPEISMLRSPERRRSVFGRNRQIVRRHLLNG